MVVDKQSSADKRINYGGSFAIHDSENLVIYSGKRPRQKVLPKNSDNTDNTNKAEKMNNNDVCKLGMPVRKVRKPFKSAKYYCYPCRITNTHKNKQIESAIHMIANHWYQKWKDLAEQFRGSLKRERESNKELRMELNNLR